MERITVWLARIGFLSIAACTFGLSFDAISDVARQTGAVDPSLAWIVPLAVDGMIVTATAVLWTESLSGRGWHMFPLLAIISPAALSMWANIAHASGQSLLAQVLAAVPPAGLILSLELVAWQIRRERNIRGRMAPKHRATGAAQPAAAQPAGAARPAGRNGSGRAVSIQDPREQPVPEALVEPVPTRAASNGPRVDTRGDEIHVDRDDDTGRIRLDIPNEHRGKEVWTRIIAAVQESGAVPTQRELASELNVPRSRVQRAIERNRAEWDELRERVETPQTASVGAAPDDG
jgi:Protein of unknown function (DUF2637)